MAKVFTITDGLENLGALKTGGQGSVYKGRRVGEIITAIKLLPTPIHSEDPNDKHYRDFSNEVEKLKKVNEEPNSNVVTILGSGITDTGSLPFIEMEYIEGPDLGELLKPPHDPVFTVQEVIKLSLHLSNALAHCHQCDVKHGDIKSNNVKFNRRTGNYMLLDFGLAVMSDEDRRTSLRHAGAIEFMAPEQNQGLVEFQTDVYSFGVIVFELLAGQVPFPLHDSGETARHAVMVSHMETPPPDILELRSKNLPAKWPEEKKELEMQVPEWLLGMVYKCLQKNPENRFNNGQELHDYVVLNNTVAARKQEIVSVNADVMQADIQRLMMEKEQLQQQLISYQNASADVTPFADVETEYDPPRRTVSRGAFYLVLLLAVLFGGVALYALMNQKPAAGIISSEMQSDSLDSVQKVVHSNEVSETNTTREKEVETRRSEDSLKTTSKADTTQSRPVAPGRKEEKKDSSAEKAEDTTTNGGDQPGLNPENLNEPGEIP